MSDLKNLFILLWLYFNQLKTSLEFVWAQRPFHLYSIYVYKNLIDEFFCSKSSFGLDDKLKRSRLDRLRCQVLQVIAKVNT